MKYLNLIILFMVLSLSVKAQELPFDAKYVKIGYMSSSSVTVLKNNNNFRQIGKVDFGWGKNPKEMATAMTNEGVGKQALDLLFQRDQKGLHIDQLYETALDNVTIEEMEVAINDASAEAKDVLKKRVARQLLKNNYIILTKEEVKHNDWNYDKVRIYWQVYHIDVTDEIIDQAFLNWNKPEIYDQIKVPVTFVAGGKSKERKFFYDMAKKVKNFAIRGAVYNRRPFLSRATEAQGVKECDRFYVYRLYENSKGNLDTRKVCTARATETTYDYTRLFSISGKYASAKKGDIAVLRDHGRSAVSLLWQGSFGEDARNGGRLQYEYLLNFSKKGIAQYFLAAAEYNMYKKEPENVWFHGDGKTVQPTLSHASFMLGYGVGFNLLGRIELMPYALIGWQFSPFINGGDTYTWNHDKAEWVYYRDQDVNERNETTKINHSLVGYAGLRMSINLWYPVQLVLSADYNIYQRLTHVYDNVLDRHELNRLNVYTGLKINF